MKKINTIIVDDEESAINTLRGMINNYFPQIEVVAVANNVDDALQKAAAHQPSLVFLDVEMPPFGSGFDFLEKCPNRNFGVIFVTAYPKYAIKAINDAQPWGYLVKPYSVNELTLAIEKAEEKIKELNEVNSLINEEHSLVLPDARKGNVVIRTKDIVYCEADGTTTDIFYQKEGKMLRFTASRTLKDVEEQLPIRTFCRSHHSYLVNLAFVDRYERTGRNGIIHFKDGSKAPISVGKMEDFEDRFLQFSGG
ncbi:MAG: response regulator transcription factor [Saprospiraceae bacterium]|nr:response regulator transcription factor [Saprospiraceae bacterium]